MRHAALLIIPLLLVLASCAVEKSGKQASPRLPRTLRVATLYSPTSFFLYRGDTLGYDYDRISDFAADRHIALRFTVGHDLQELTELLRSGKVDVLACPVPITAQFNGQVLHCGQTVTTSPVLVQRKGRGRVRRLTQLAGKTISVQRGTPFDTLLQAANRQFHGLIKVRTVDPDSFGTDKLIDLVSQGKIDMTIVNSDLAHFDRSYYSNLDISLEVGMPQRSSWAVSDGNDWLADSIDAWSSSQRTIKYSQEASARYFEQDKSQTFTYEPQAQSQRAVYRKGAGDLSPFDGLFKQNAPFTPYPWTLLAAVACTESNFNPNDVSWAGATGLMQIMPGTARSHGYTRDDMLDPAKNVRVGAQCLADLDRRLSRRVTNPYERLRFVLASYNAGQGHVLDAMALAEKLGKDPTVWYGNVEEALALMSNPRYYNDPVCHYGYFRANETVNYVRRVEQHYEQFKNHP